MSIKAIGWAFEQKIPATTKLVLLKLADNANDDGWCWPSQSTLSRHTGLARETVNRHIRKLADAGLLRIKHRQKDGVSLPNHYLLNLRGVVTEDHRGSDGGSQGVVTEDHTEPSVEPSFNLNGQPASPPDRFADFWESYPKKRKKAEARKKWKAKKLDRLADQIIEDVKKRQRQDRRWLDGFVPDPTTYLNGERWDDEIEVGSGDQATELRPPAQRRLN